MLVFFVQFAEIPEHSHENLWILNSFLEKISEILKIKFWKCENVWRNLAEFFNAERHTRTLARSVFHGFSIGFQRHKRCKSVPVCTLFSLLLQAPLLRSDSFFSVAVCFVRRTLARTAFHGFSIGFQRCKSVYFIFNFGSFLQKTHKCKSCRTRQELSNENLLAEVGFDAAENEPCQKLAKSSNKS